MKSNTKVNGFVKKQTIDQVLAERKNTHGDFTENAQISQDLTTVLRNSSGWANLSADKKEALEMIMHKAARICTGNANEEDHWRDIGGYSKLAQDRCITEVGQPVYTSSKRSR